MRFHILGLPHTVTSNEYNACAYTQKVVKFGKMMKSLGHEIIHYGHEDSNLICDEHVTVIGNKDLEKAYGSYDWRNNFFKFDTSDHAYQTFYKNAIAEVGKRKQKHDFILPFWGSGVKPVCDAHNDMIVVEPGIGYAGGHWARWKIFESYAIYHAYCGMQGVGTCKQDWYEVVIPNYFDTEDFVYNDVKDDYFLFLGRVYDGKGVHIAIQATEKAGQKLVIAGQKPDDMRFPNHVEFVGYADINKRKELMSKAKGAFVASMYVEPFGGVQIEMLMSGTPTITTDWGSFVENNIHGVTGYRCRTFDHFVWATNNIHNIKSSDCRTFAENFTLEKVGPMYEEYFENVLDVYKHGGWYQKREDRKNLDWLYKKYPSNLSDEPNSNFLFDAISKLGKDTNFVVIGAMDGIKHDGLYPYLISNPEWKGIMVEPVTDQFNNLCKNFQNFNNIQFENSAITEKTGTAVISRLPLDLIGKNVPIWADGISTLKTSEKMTINQFEKYVIKESVKTLSVTDFIKKYKIKRIDLLQIDVEGYDFEIFLELWNNDFRPRVLKIEKVYFTEHEFSMMCDLLQKSGYTFKIIGDDIVACIK